MAMTAAMNPMCFQKSVAPQRSRKLTNKASNVATRSWTMLIRRRTLKRSSYLQRPGSSPAAPQNTIISGVLRPSSGVLASRRAGMVRYSLAVRTPDHAPDRLPWGLVGSLSLAQLISWGTVFYAFTLFMDPMTRELGWSKPELAAAYSLGLVASGLGAMPVGRLIDLGYCRFVMTSGSVLATALFLVWSQVETYAVFLALWIGLGFAMSALLYEAGFAVLTRTVGPLSRRAITAMTLV